MRVTLTYDRNEIGSAILDKLPIEYSDGYSDKPGRYISLGTYDGKAKDPDAAKAEITAALGEFAGYARVEVDADDDDESEAAA